MTRGVSTQRRVYFGHTWTVAALFPTSLVHCVMDGYDAKCTSVTHTTTGLLGENCFRIMT